MNKPERHCIAMCSAGRIGVVTCDSPQEITYFDGNKGMAWVGIHIAPPEWSGKPWSSRNPTVLAYLDESGQHYVTPDELLRQRYPDPPQRPVPPEIVCIREDQTVETK